ncbi:TPA: hypothetical protein ACX87D_000070 [Legionella pneumophila]
MKKVIFYVLPSLMLASLFNLTYADETPAQLTGTPAEQIQQLNAQIQSQLQEMQTKQQQQLDALNAQLQNQIKQVQSQLQEQIQTVNSQTQDQIKQVQTTLQEQIKQIQQQALQKANQ